MDMVPTGCVLAAASLSALIAAAPTPAAAQTPAALLVTVLDTDGVPVAGLTRADFTVHQDDVEVEVVSVQPVAPSAQVVVIFEGLAATQQQTSAALTRFITSLDDDSIVDMQSVDGQLDAAIVEAVTDLHARDAARPVIVMLGQATEIARSDLQSSQVHGRRQAADLTEIDELTALLAEHGIVFYGVSVTEVSLTNFEMLAADTGGRFEVLTAPDRLGDTLAALGRELGTQYLVSHTGSRDGSPPRLEVLRPGLTVRVAAFAPTH